MRINREVNRSTGCSDDLWNRALYLLARGYRDALQGGSLRNESAQADDLLNLKDEVNALADLLLMRDLEPPMAVGILGGWGGGKSYIMHLMQQHMTEVRSRKVNLAIEAWNPDPNHEKLSPYVGHIYQIKFDAWTFAKSNLWASLMQTIFFELDRQLTLEKNIEAALRKRKDDALKVIKDPEQCKQIEQEYDRKNQTIEQQIWPVLYKNNDAEREWFLKRVLKDDSLLKVIESNPTKGGLWRAIDDIQKDDKERLRRTRQQLETVKAQLNRDRTNLRQTIFEHFEPLLKVQENKSVRQIDALLGTSFELLRRRIGPKLFQDLTRQIQLELYGPSPQARVGLAESIRNAIGKPLFGDSSEKSSATPSPAPETLEDDTQNKNSEEDNSTSSKTLEPTPQSSDSSETLESTPQSFDSEAASNAHDKGLWRQLNSLLNHVEVAREKLRKLESDESENKDVHEESKESSDATSEVSTTHSSGLSSDSDEQRATTKTAQKIENQKQAIELLLKDVTAIRLDILDIATTVVERNYYRVIRATAKRWMRRHWIPILLTTCFVLIAIGLLIFYELNPVETSTRVITRLATLIAPTLPTVILLRNLINSGSMWFEETRLALKEYETSVEQKNKQREERIETIIEQHIAKDETLKLLEQDMKRLEQQVIDQAALIPVNQYATLADFVSGRIEAETYQRHLGLMHQVKEDLFDLSNKLLPPKHYDPRFKTQIDDLKKVFPRGTARVVVYIDDLDRCPPNRVVEVLEAVQLLVKTPLFIAVLAVDERYITRALEKYYDGVLSRRGRPSGTDYLEKIIQLPYRVRPIMPNALEEYLKNQVVIQDNATGGTKFSEFSRQEFNMLLECCKQTDLSPRTLKRLTNVYKLFKIVCRTRGTKLRSQVQQAILALLALSGRYPNLMRGIFDEIETCFEENRDPQKDRCINERKAQHKNIPVEKLTFQALHLQTPLPDFFKHYQLPITDHYLQREFDKLQHDALDTGILPPITLADMTHEIFNLVRSFSFVGEVGEDPDDHLVNKSATIDSMDENTSHHETQDMA